MSPLRDSSNILLGCLKCLAQVAVCPKSAAGCVQGPVGFALFGCANGVSWFKCFFFCCLVGVSGSPVGVLDWGGLIGTPGRGQMENLQTTGLQTGGESGFVVGGKEE